MVKIAYGYIQNCISSLSDISNDGEYFLNFEQIDFLVKYKKLNNNLVIIFHGAAPPGENRVIFRGYDYILKNTDILCVSDYLINRYSKINTGWFLSTQKYNTESVYLKIFDYFISKKKYEKIIFTGTSAGGYPSIRYASYFNQTALISNAQLYLEKYGENYSHFGFCNVSDIIKQEHDKLLYENKNIEKHILISNPKQIICYNNIYDTTFSRDIVFFVNFISQNNLRKILDITLFPYADDMPENKTHHHIQFPNDKKHLNIVESHL